MRAYDIHIQFPAAKRTDQTDATDAKPPVKILKAVWLEGVDPQFEAIQHVAPMWGTNGLTITAQPSE